MSKIQVMITEPQDMMDKVEGELKETLRTDPFSAMLILPTPGAVRQVEDRLLSDGLVLLGGPICTLDQIVLALFEDGTVKDIEIDAQQAELIIQDIMEEDRASVPAFEPLWGGIGPTVSELRALFDTWRNFLIDVKNEEMDGVASHAKFVFVKYVDFLKKHHFNDNAAMKETVLEWLIEGRVKSRAKIWMMGMNELCPLDRELVKAIANSSEETIFIARQDRGKTFSPDFSWLGAESEQGEVLAPVEQVVLARPAVSVAPMMYRDPLSEARGVACKVKALIDSGCEPSEICVLLPMREKLAPLYREALEDSGVWCNMDVPTDLMQSPIVHSLLDLLDAVVEDLPREHVVRMLGSPYLRFKYSHEGREVYLHGGVVEKIANESGVIGGQAQWEDKIRNLVDDLLENASSSEVPEDRAKKMREKAQRATLALIGLRELFVLLRTIDGPMTVKQRLVFLKNVLMTLEADKHLENEDVRTYGREAKALAGFFDVLDEMEGMERLSPRGAEDLRSFASRVRLLCSGAKGSLEPKYESAVLVSGLRASAMTRHQHVFIPGMVEGDIPFLGAGNPFISDEDVARFRLLNRRDMLRQERLYFFSAMMSATKSVTLSSHETDGGSKVVSSSFFDDIARTKGGVVKEMTDAGSSKVVQQRLLGKAIIEDAPLTGLVQSFIADTSELIRRINVERYHRTLDYDSPFDGMLTDQRILIDLQETVGPDHIFSPTELDMYASCPQRYYLNRVLGIEPRPQLELEISGKDQGTFVHQVAFRLLTRMREVGMGRISVHNLEAVQKMAKEIADEELDELRFAGPAFLAFRARMAGSVHRKGLLQAFLEFEAKNTTSFDPTFFELSFGRKLPEDCDPRSQVDPVRITLSPEVEMLLAGRMDRVDMRKDGSFMVIDYKTGETPKQKDVLEGKSLQVQLYLQAVQAMIPGSKGIGGIFYRVKSESEIEYTTLVLDKREETELKPIIGRKKLIESTDALLADTNQRLANMLTDMRSGKFHPALDEKDCKSYCEYKHVCRFDAQRVLDMGGL